VADFPGDFEPRYNVAPTQPVLVVRDLETRNSEWMKWGLIPFWAKDPTIGARMINARSETLAEKPSFKQSFFHRRCLILADGFFEWQKSRVKHPSLFTSGSRVASPLLLPVSGIGGWHQTGRKYSAVRSSPADPTS